MRESIEKRMQRDMTLSALRMSVVPLAKMLEADDLTLPEVGDICARIVVGTSGLVVSSLDMMPLDEQKALIAESPQALAAESLRRIADALEAGALFEGEGK